MSYNIISCAGWGQGASYLAAGGCMKSRLALVILFFLVAMIRKWGAEEMGISFSFIFALIGSILPYLIVITLFGSFKVALVVGILGGLIGGYGGGMFFDDSDGGGE